jgi:hypothetical protein
MSRSLPRVQQGILAFALIGLSVSAFLVGARREVPAEGQAVIPASQPVATWPSPVGELDPAAHNAGVDQNWWHTVSAGLAQKEYEAAVADGGLQAPNRTHNLRTQFGPEGIVIGPRLAGDPDGDPASGWRFAWSTSACGRPGQMTAAAPAVPECHGSRVSYARSGWSEWYENTPEGLEQGFTLDRRPPGTGPLRIAGALAAELTPELNDGEVDFFVAGGARVLHYGKLVTYDANGREVPSRIALEECSLVIEVDDHGATYPLTIDPLMTSPAWMAESNQVEAQLGLSVSTAGDVNGDGFSDVILGAARYDKGRAFVYRGSAGGLAATPAWMAESNQASGYFGVSVGTAGDVNKDGFSDVIVGADYYSNGQVGEGRAYVYHGSAAGLATTPAWTAESNQPDGNFGASVSTAGDVNGDGFSDVIVGAGYYSNGQTGEGRAYVFHGSAAGLATTPAWTAEPNQANAAFGTSVATAGDVNGDGYADVIIGAYNYDNGQSGEGRAFAYHGSSAGLNPTPAWTAESNQEFAYYGGSAATAGDVNGDGYADVIVGAYLYDNGQDAEGRAFVYHGSAAGLAATAAWNGESNQAGALFGASVGTAGDVNGDGYADVIVSASGYDNGEDGEGRAYVYQGSAVGLIAPSWSAESDQTSAAFGATVGTAGDVNGDGYSDVLVGAPGYDNGEANEGRTFLYHGGSSGLSSLPMFWTTGGQGGCLWGWAVGPAGDVNGDGYSDVYAVAATFDNGQGDEGKVWVYHGSLTGIPANPAWSAETNQVGAEISSAASAGDVNGDGYSDFIFGSYAYDGLGGSNSGRAVLHLGSAAGLSPTAVWSADGDQTSAWLGTAVGGAGDVNGDGFADFLIGADGYDNEQVNEGGAWLYEGSANALFLPGWRVEGGQDGAFLGYSLGTAGDVNRDGFADVLIGAPTLDHGEADEGAVWVFYGTTGGLDTTPGRVLEVNQAGASFGGCVATAGDVNGDGYADVIIGADQYDSGQVDEGKAFLYYGGSTGIGTTPVWTAESDQTSAWLGKAAGTAGDVNGDGYSDLAIGAPRYDDGETDEGRVWVYHGSPAGPGPAILVTQGDQPGALYGYSVGTAGDVNGDGFSEAIAGAPGYDFTVVDGGLVLVMPGNQGDGLHRTRRQLRVNELVPIDSGGRSDSQSGFRVQALARTPAGRGKVRIQIEAKPVHTPFDGTGLLTSPLIQTGFPAAPDGSTVPVLHLVSGLAPGRMVHWRVRIASDSPFFPRSPWLWHPANSTTEGDVRTGGIPVGIAEAAAPPAVAAELGPAVPNPFRQSTQLAYTLPYAAEARLGVFDVQGRLVANLVEGPQARGSHQIRWDGRNASGHPLPAGVYFVRLEFDGHETARKVVMSP